MLRPRASLWDQATVVLLAIKLAAWLASFVVYIMTALFRLGAGHAARRRRSRRSGYRDFT
jgi:hypothetical protein